MTNKQYISFWKVFGRFPSKWDEKHWIPLTKDNEGFLWVKNKESDHESK